MGQVQNCINVPTPIQWTRVFTDTNMTGNNGYLSGLVSGSPITFYLPRKPSLGIPPYAKYGDIYSIVNELGSSMSIKCNEDQGIYYTATLLNTSSIFTNVRGACITLQCIDNAGALFIVLSTNGLTFTVT